jgi:hypothetical protein
MNEGAVKLIRRNTNHISDPRGRAEARALLTRGWREGNHRERGKLRRLMLMTIRRAGR